MNFINTYKTAKVGNVVTIKAHFHDGRGGEDTATLKGTVVKVNKASIHVLNKNNDVVRVDINNNWKSLGKHSPKAVKTTKKKAFVNPLDWVTASR